MPSTRPSTFSPVTLSRTWLDVFDALDQWDEVSNFYAYHARELDTVQGSRRLCSPKIGHLVALRAVGVQLVHHIHHEDEVDGFQGDEGELWALTGAGGTTASMLVIGTRCAYDRLTGDANTWSSMTDWITKKDVTKPPAQAKSTKLKTLSKTPAATKRKTPASTVRTRRSSGAMTQKMKDYKQSLMPDQSDEEVEEEEELSNDENVDPVELKNSSEKIPVPNVLCLAAI